MKNSQSIRSLFALPGFVVGAGSKGLFGDRYARVIQLKRRKKQAVCSYCGQRCRGRYDKQVCRVRDLSLAGWRIYLEYERWRVNCSGCGGVHVEHLDWLANNSRYTQRFATHGGKLCRDMPNKAVAEMERLHHGTVKALDTLYMQEQVDRAGLPAPRAIGVDEISIRKGHNYRVIVSDLERARPIWVGGEGNRHRFVLQGAGRKEKRPYQAGRHGYVEALPELGDSQRA